MTKFYWGSDGLPPIGEVCSFQRIDCLQKPELKDGQEVTIIAHFKSQFGIDVAAFTFDYGGRRYVECATKECFRPVSSEQREAAVERMMHTLERYDNEARLHCGMLYDALYCKADRKTGEE